MSEEANGFEVYRATIHIIDGFSWTEEVAECEELDLWAEEQVEDMAKPGAWFGGDFHPAHRIERISLSDTPTHTVD